MIRIESMKLLRLRRPDEEDGTIVGHLEADGDLPSPEEIIGGADDESID